MVRQKLGSYIFAERCYSPCQRGCDMVNDCQNGRCGDIGKIVGITMMMILYIWILITTTNLFSALFGSTIGLSVGAAAHYAFVISARYGFENTLIKNINPLAVIFNMSENRRSIVTSVIVMGVILFAVCVIFCTYVNRSDVSLNNKEILV